jgi:hypothetical protein
VTGSLKVLKKIKKNIIRVVLSAIRTKHLPNANMEHSTPEDGSLTFPRGVGKYLPHYTAVHCKKDSDLFMSWEKADKY